MEGKTRKNKCIESKTELEKFWRFSFETVKIRCSHLNTQCTTVLLETAIRCVLPGIRNQLSRWWKNAIRESQEQLAFLMAAWLILEGSFLHNRSGLSLSKLTFWPDGQTEGADRFISALRQTRWPLLPKYILTRAPLHCFQRTKNVQQTFSSLHLKLHNCSDRGGQLKRRSPQLQIRTFFFVYFCVWFHPRMTGVEEPAQL